MKSKPQLSIVVPCYNEKGNIPLLVKRFKETLSQSVKVELVLVDNGSTDGSHQLIKEIVEKEQNIKMIWVKKNIGYGFGIWSGLRKAKGEYLCWTHADLQTDIKDAFKAYEIAKGQPNPERCFVKGNRKGRQFIESFFTFGMSVFETLILGTLLYDINAQPNLFHRSFLKKLGEPPKDFSFDLYFYYMAKKLGYKILRFSVFFKQRIHGQSHWNISLKGKWKFIKRTLHFTLKLRMKLQRREDTK